VQAGEPADRLAAYLLAMSQAPALVRGWSWWLSAWQGVWPSRTREALADAAGLDHVPHQCPPAVSGHGASGGMP
jgi:hypothetical protein